MSDLVSGLLAHLDELEREHHRAAEEMRQAARMKISNVLGDYVLASIADGLRLCRAHRDLIGLHREGGMVQVGHDADTASRFAYCTTCGPVGWPCDTLRAVARGLGVEEQSSE